MKTEEEKLAEYRLKAAEQTQGISTDPILNMVIASLEKHNLEGSILDYGAGAGNLITKLLKLDKYELTGVDIQAKPKSLPDSVSWFQQDLNIDFDKDTKFDIVISTEVIEHLENPRSTFRNIFKLTKPGGHAILTTPNQNSIRSLTALCFGGMFADFRDACYPAHITALTHIDMTRIANETGFEFVEFAYTNRGQTPKFTLNWQKLSFGLFKGKLFSDNFAVVLRRPDEKA